MKKTGVKSRVISARLPMERVNLVEEIAREDRVDKSAVIDRALEHYIKEWRLRKAVELYRKGSITLSRAAEIAETSIWEMIDVLEKRKVQLQYDLGDLEEDLKLVGRG